MQRHGPQWPSQTRGLPPSPPDCSFQWLQLKFLWESRGCWLGGGPLHGLPLLLPLQLRFWSKWQSLPNLHATAQQPPVSDHHLLTIRRPGPLLLGFGAQWDLHNASFHEALPSILQRCLSAWLQRWGHHLVRSSLSVCWAWRPWLAENLQHEIVEGWGVSKSTLLPPCCKFESSRYLWDTTIWDTVQIPSDSFKDLQDSSVFCANDCSKYGETQKKPLTKTLLNLGFWTLAAFFSGFCSKSLGFKIQPPSWVVQPPPKRRAKKCHWKMLLGRWSPFLLQPGFFLPCFLLLALSLLMDPTT